MLFTIRSTRAVLKPAVGVISKIPARQHSGTAGYVRDSSGPPRVRFPFSEKITHGIVMFIGVNIIPVWISSNISVYNGRDAAAEEQ